MKSFFLFITTISMFLGTTFADTSKAFDAESIDDIFKVLNISKTKESNKICLGVDNNGTDIAPIKIYNKHTDITDMYLIIEENKHPLAAHFSFSENMSDFDKNIDFLMKRPLEKDSKIKVVVKSNNEHYVSNTKLLRAVPPTAYVNLDNSTYQGNINEYVMQKGKSLAKNGLKGTKLFLKLNHPSTQNLYINKLKLEINDVHYYSAEFNRNILTSNSRIKNLLYKVPRKGSMTKYTLGNNLNNSISVSKKITGISKNEINETIINSLNAQCLNKSSTCQWEQLFSKVDSRVFFNSDFTKSAQNTDKYKSIKIRYPATKNDGWEWKEKLLLELIENYPKVRTSNTLTNECEF